MRWRSVGIDFRNATTVARSDDHIVLDYNLEFGRDPALFDTDTPFRSSDHDPIIVGLTLDAN